MLERVSSPVTDSTPFVRRTAENSSRRSSDSTAAWAALNDIELPDALPAESHADLRRHGLGRPTLSDPAETLPEETRRWAEEYARRQVGEIQDRIFPLHGL